MSKKRALAPLLLAIFALAMTSVLAYADAGPKHKLSVAASVVVSDAESYANAHGGYTNHGDLVSAIAKNWDDFMNGKSYGHVNKGQIMRIIAHSHLGKG